MIKTLDYFGAISDISQSGFFISAKLKIIIPDRLEFDLARTTSKNITINPPDFLNAILKGSDLYIHFSSFSSEAESVLIKIIHRYLEKYDLMYLREAIISIVKELIANAVKANLKRLFFKMKGLDINKPEEYRRGMESFKEEIFEEDNEYFDKLEQSNLAVRVLFKSAHDRLRISIVNNVVILESELVKINSRVKKAYKYSDIAEAFDDVLDDSEGAGLGLIMAMMLFKNSGFPADSFRIYKKDDLTVSSISIFHDMREVESKIKITGEIMKEVDEIPAFPKNIIMIQRLCSNPESTMKVIADHISLDPGLTTSILKLSNSAGYVTMKRIESIEDAAKVIGIKGINTLLMATGVHKVIDSRYKRFEQIWENSYKRAYYSQKISIETKRNRFSESAYLSALLSDIGTIVILSINHDLMLKLREVAGRKGIEDPNLLEEISLGISHSTIGGMICSKWKFNESLIKAVEFHHRPHMSPEKFRDLIYIVYLADCFTEIEKSRFRFDFIDEDVLKHFNLTEKKSFDYLHNMLKEGYSNQMKIQMEK